MHEYTIRKGGWRLNYASAINPPTTVVSLVDQWAESVAASLLLYRTIHIRISLLAVLEDYNQAGDHKLLVGDLGGGHFDMKLKVYRGTELTFEAPLLTMPTAMCSVYVDNTEPRTPAVAVASGSYIYMYKNLRPYFKFTLPDLKVRMLYVWCEPYSLCSG